ncbi:hypothetical protein N431DRAFT_411139 [Stipitochalara longipes BDJ]|nr:hypothetical protein N431DRAFT_411139 [Stipitochalara longipes BDJ]
MKMKKRKERDSYLDEKDVASSPKKLPSRLSSALRTGNAMTIKFNPPKSSDAQPSPISALRFPEVVPEPAPSSNRKETSQASTLETKLLINSTFSTYSQSPNWPLTANNTNKTDMTSVKPLSSGFTFWPLNVDVQSSLIQSPERRKEPPIINLLNTAKTDDTIPYTSSELKNAFDELDLGSDQEVSGAINQNMGETSPHWEQTHQRRETPDEIVFNPFEDGEEEQISHQEEDPKVSELEQQPEISKPLGGKVSVENFPARNSYSETTQFFRTLETRVRHEISLNPLEDSAQKPLNESTEEPADQTLSEIASVPPLEQQTEEWSFEQLLPKQPTRVPKAETLALLQDEEQARSSTVPEIDKLLRIVAQDNERLADKPLFWSDFRPVEEDVESAMEMPPVRESKVKKDIAPLRESLPQEGDERGSENMARETMTSPFLMDPAVETELLYPDIQQQPPALVERNPEPLALPPAQERETSPLRINPQIRNITSMLAERKAVSISTALVLETETNKAGLDERQARGRSMLRTSDIIEARLSSIPQVKEDKDAPIEEHTEEERARTISPLRRNPVEITNVSYSETRNLSPLQRNLSTSISISASSMKRKSRTLSPPSLPRLNPTPTSLPSREESPLRRNPPFPIPSQPLPRPHTPTSSDPALRPQSNVGFNQTLARFQSLAEQSTVNGRQASTEVTQRAIAGIFIPGSLREQAVKNLSKSRERALGRSASAGKGL